MAEPSTHINYSFEDIQRYLQGKMSGAEMHDIEKAALQDPFLADAIEGFNEADLTTAQQHLNEINTTLLKERPASKVVAFNKKTQWLNIAAVIIILGGIGLIGAYFFRSSSRQNQIAQVKTEPVKNEALKDSAMNDNVAASSSKQPDTSLLIAENKAAEKTTTSALKKEAFKKDIPAEKNLEENNAEVASVAAAPVELNSSNMTAMMDSSTYYPKSVSAAPRINTDVALAGKVSGLSVLPTTFSGKVVDENHKPIIGVTIESADKKNAVLTDMDGNFSLQKNDTALNVIASTVGYYTTNKTLQAGYNTPIILKGSGSALNDVVVVGYGAAKKRNAFADSLIRAQQKALPDSAMPVGGWQNFNQYVMTQLNKDSTDELIANADELVEMEFMVDKLGNPYNIKITKPLDGTRNAKALEILKNGPKWTNNARHKKAKVVIAF